LTFYAGEVIAVMRRSGVDGGNVDDGWLQGKLLPDEPVRILPSFVVKECGPNGEDLSPIRVIYMMRCFIFCYRCCVFAHSNVFIKLLPLINASFSSMC